MRRHGGPLFLLGLVVVAALLGLAQASASGKVTLEFGKSIDPAVQTRLSALLRPFLASSGGRVVGGPVLRGLALSLGDTATTRALIPAAELAALGSEGFIVRARLNNATGVLVVAADGNPMLYPTINPTANIGAHFAAYEVLQRLGFGFLHPLQPLVPDQLDLSFADADGGRFELATAPHFAIRGVHHHTEHPLELMEFLNGFDITYPAAASAADVTPPMRHADVTPTMKGETWESMVGDWERALEWTVANRQNRWEWVLLWAKDWNDFAWSELRRTRLTRIVDIAHAWGVVAGADCGIAITQQHGWPLIENVTNEADEQRQIERHLDWLLRPSSDGGCGYDFLSTESGFSEFNHPDCTQMLRWMNMTTAYTAKLGKEAFIKCHCSTGQVCADYKDPLTGQPINFNLLPHYASPDLGIYPHTVQYYNWTEPAPTYGNQNFSYMLDFLKFEADRRKTIYHGETAYWVNYDIDVPLFLPIYAHGRLSDLRAIAATKTLGQMNFNSGWEWGYWLSDVVTARASWDPRTGEPSEARAMAAILREHVFGVTFGAAREQLVQLVLDTIDLQRDLLLYGKVDGKLPSTVVKRNGQAYLEGWDTWSELGALVSPSASTQPNKLGIVEVRDWLGTSPQYWTEVEPLLDAMEANFSALATRYAALLPLVPKAALPFYRELVDSANITALRAKLVHRLYNFAASYWKESKPYRERQMAEAKSALASAAQVVAAREADYRVPLERIAGWRQNPTVYTYGYLWTVHSLFYWWRDLGKSLDDMSWEAYFSPCYLNVIDPINVAFGEGITLNVTHELYQVFERFKWMHFIGDCLSSPPKEPSYPADLF